jgi:hypothetical protein
MFSTTYRCSTPPVVKVGLGMLLLFFLLGSLLSGEDAAGSMACTGIASIHTREVLGPKAVFAFLRIYSEDDHFKALHACMAEYQLVILPFRGGAAESVPLLSADGDWDRPLSVHLDGFSQDGKRIFGTLSEGGTDPFTKLFDYDRATRKSTIVDLKKALARLRAVKCGRALAVAGTTESGALVVQPRTAEPCRSQHRWVLDATTGDVQSLPPGKSVVERYNAANPPSN